MTADTMFSRLKLIGTVISAVSDKLLIFLCLQIRRLLSGMVCAQDGQLQTGDKLVSVNGVSLKGVTHSMALQLLKKPMDVVTFVILREGLQTQGKVTSSSLNQSVAQTPAQNSAIPQDREEHTQTLLSITERVDKPQSVGQPVTFIDVSQGSSFVTRDETTQEQVREIPCSPPPSPVLGMDDLLDGDVTIPPPSFSPPPPPITSDVTSSNDDDLHLSSIPIVAPPPDLSPRMKEFIDKDLFNTEDGHEIGSQESTHQEETLQESSAMLNRASSPSNDTTIGWDFESLLEACNDLNSHESDDVSTFGQSSVTETPLVPGDSKPKLSSPEWSQAKISKENSVVPVESSTEIQPLVVGGGNDLPSIGAKNRRTIPGRTDNGNGLQTLVKALDVAGELTSLTPPVSRLHSKDSSESESSEDVKPVAGRRVENVPFVITYQKKFRSLGMKVDLSEEGKVIVAEVSSFGLVGKDGNIRYE